MNVNVSRKTECQIHGKEDRLTDIQTNRRKKKQVRKRDTCDCHKLPHTCGFGELKEVIC